MWNRGVSLYLTIIIISILLAIVLGLSAILVGQIKMLKGMENSVVAFYAADTGIERILMYRADPINNNTCTKSNPCQLDNEAVDNEAEYYVEVEAGAACGADNYCIKSFGNYEGTIRAIEIKY